MGNNDSTGCSINNGMMGTSFALWYNEKGYDRTKDMIFSAQYLHVNKILLSQKYF